MLQDYPQGCVYCFEEKQYNITCYALLYTDETNPHVALRSIETKYPELCGKLKLFHSIRVANIADAEAWIETRLRRIRHDGLGRIEFHDDRSHDLRIVQSQDDLTGQELKQLMNRFLSRSTSQKIGFSEIFGLTVLVILSSVFLGLRVNPAYQNYFKHSDRYESCVNNNGGDACKQYRQVDQSCVSNQGGSTCEKFLK